MTTANTVTGGNPSLNQALVLTQQITMLIPVVGTLMQVGIQLLNGFTAGGDPATVEQARAEIAKLRAAGKGLVEDLDAWLDSHPKIAPGPQNS